MDELRQMIEMMIGGTSPRLPTTDINQLKAERYNEQIGDLGYADCPVCKNKGRIAIVDGNVLKFVHCSCEVERENRRRIELSGLADVVERYTFDTYDASDQWTADVKAKAMDYLDEYGWFCVTGRSGSGKTHICTAVCGELMRRGFPVRYMQWRSDAARLKAMVLDRAAYEHELAEYTDVAVLYIDDFFKGTVTDADVNLAFELLNARYNNHKRTIISSELSFKELCKIDEAVAGRIYERCSEWVNTPDINWRLRG